MELTRTTMNYAVVYVILLCALAQGGSEGKRGNKDDDFSKHDHDAAPVFESLHIQENQAELVWKHCRKELLERNNDIVQDFYLHQLEGSSDKRSVLLIENNIHKGKSLPLHMKRNFLDCMRSTSSPAAPVSKVETSSRYLLPKHSDSSSFGLTNGHGRYLISESPNDPLPPKPSTSSVPSPGPAFESPRLGPPSRRGPSPASSASTTPSPTPDPSSDDYTFPPDMFAPFSPPPPRRGNPPNFGKFPAAIYAPNPPPPPPPPKDDDKRVKALTVAVCISGVIILIGMFLCYREIRKNKVDKDGRPLLALTSKDYSGGSKKVIRLGDNDKGNASLKNGKDPSNGRNWSLKAKDGNNSQVETTSLEGKEQTPAPPTGKPAPPPPSPPPPPPPKPPVIAPRPPPPPRAAPPAPPKPKNGKSQLAPLSAAEDAETDAPKPKLKPFFWDKVAAKPDQSMVWHEISAGSFVFNEEKMESLFGCTNQNRNERRKDSPAVDTTVHYIQIIDPRKAQNLSILLRALNVTTEEVIDAIKEGNELPVELIQTMVKMAPTSEEELKLRLFTGELSQLGPAERFLKVLVDIPFAFKRLESLMFMFILPEESSNIKESFATLEVACSKLRKSRLFMKLLEAVLKTGNRMNDGTYRGGAQAFRLDTLLKLSDVKGTDGKTTLLHFVVQEIIRSEGIRAVRTERASRSQTSVATEDCAVDGSEESKEHYRRLGLQVVSGLSTELNDVKKAAVIDGDALTTTVSKLSYSLGKTQEFLNKELKDIEEDDVFKQCMERFVEKAKDDVTWLVEEEKRIMALVKSTADYFHGNAGKDEGLRLFLIVRDFLIILDKVCKEVRDTTMKSAKASYKSKEASQSVPSSPDTARQNSSPSELHRRLFPAIAERRVDYFSSDDEDDEGFET
ncbi:hypothetical protein RIF29_31529 [Crotalaria pallida]|uniref:Formin-like protein n=1 Tax=Crotalaria pallida TaxID=3830 RepID=A0AAN9EMJ7_CROPI